MDLLEQVQRRAIKMAERVGVIQPGEERRLWQDLIAAFQYFKGSYKKDGDKLFSRACSNRTRGNGFKLEEGRFRLDRRKKFFTVRVVKHWNRLPREVVDAPSLETLKVRLDGALSNLIGGCRCSPNSTSTDVELSFSPGAVVSPVAVPSSASHPAHGGVAHEYVQVACGSSP
ncbi:hypothetical protein QYF61_007261 [Mycteria americana]|uniref:Uncharacterized protein n=1 Tax=Mycteria americana TaxID=33587 RepID=A0AAN7NSU7_MYCAM|nr:hypothetical protein QYF61_007261 [Mycteria americana]